MSIHFDKETALDLESYLSKQEEKRILRVITCGSVDDGKSTLIGRLLYESHMLYEDQLESLLRDSKNIGTQGEGIDFALLVDGLAAEREQGITIDVAYRYFSTEKRKYIIADTPGHEEYTRNMATGASTADLAIILVDASQGMLTQTKRHSFIVSLTGVKKVILAVNKLDLVDYSQESFNRIVQDYQEFVHESLDIHEVVPVPISALHGVNIMETSKKTPWYNGPTIMSVLESAEEFLKLEARPFRMPVQWVNRPSPDFRGFAGLISSGVISVGDELCVMPAGKETKIERIVTYDGDLESASAGSSVTLTLADDLDISRGDILSSVESACEIADQFQVRMIWMDGDHMVPGRQYVFKSNSQSHPMTVTELKYSIDVNTMEKQPAKILRMNEIGVCNISIDERIAYDNYNSDRALGGFIIIDKITNNTAGMGFIDFALRRSKNIVWHHMDVTKESRAIQKGQRPLVIWFTGLSGSGKSSIANVLERKLNSMGRHTITLDGDNIRHGLSRDLGFTASDRVENIRRIAETAKLMADAGLICITSFISPFASERSMARGLLDAGEFVEVFVETPLEICEERDIKGLYKKARSGELPNFTGISSPYETPEFPEIKLDTQNLSIEESADIIIDYIFEHKGV